MSKDAENVAKLVTELHKALSAKGTKVDPKTLEQALNEAHKAATVGCDSCANGWHW